MAVGTGSASVAQSTARPAPGASPRYAGRVQALPRSRLSTSRVPRRGLALTLIALFAVALAGCGGGKGGRGAGGGATGGTGGAGGEAAERGPLSEAECMQLLDHYLELAMAEKRATLPAEQVPTEEQVERIRASMRTQAQEECVGRGERGRYECAMKATTTRGLGVCLTDAAEES